MLEKTRGIVLRSVKYGETSLIATLFTEQWGVTPFLVQGIRKKGRSSGKTSLFQPSALLELIAHPHPGKNLQRLRDYQSGYLYQSITSDVIKNVISFFSVEVLLRVLPEKAPQPELFGFCFTYFQKLDQFSQKKVANFPVFFLMQVLVFLGYPIQGEYSKETPYLNYTEGGFSAIPPSHPPFLDADETQIVDRLLKVSSLNSLENIQMASATRFDLLEWHLAFLHLHTQHLGAMKSLSVLKTILHV